MDKKFIQIGLGAVLIRFLLCGGFADVFALLIVSGFYLANEYFQKPKVDSDLQKMEADLEELKSKVSALTLASAFKVGK